MGIFINLNDNWSLIGMDKNGNLFTLPVTVPRASAKLCLKPDKSITLPHYQYHAFWADEGFCNVFISEVSMVNDDNSDNRFLEEMGRFPKIE